MLHLQKSLDLHRVVQARIQNKGFIDLVSDGYSMYPFIRPGDECRFVKTSLSNMFPGDIILFSNDKGQLIGHRLLHVVGEQPNEKYFFKGDTNLHPDNAVSSNNILGKLAYIKRRQHLVYLNSMFHRLWTWTILNVPTVPTTLRKWLIRRRIWKYRINKLKIRFTWVFNKGKRMI